MGSAMGDVVRQIRRAVIDAAQHADGIGDLPRLHQTQLATMRRRITGQDHYDGGTGGGPSRTRSPGGGTGRGDPDAPPSRPGDIPERTPPYDGPNRTKDKGDYGERVTDDYMGERGYTRISHRNGPNGIDGIYVNDKGELIIVESKYNTAGLDWIKDPEGVGGRTRQMTDRWLEGPFHNHEESRIRAALSELEDEELVEAIEKLYRSGDVPPLLARVGPDGQVKITLPEFNPDGTIASNPSINF